MADGDPIAGTKYTHGQELTSPGRVDCVEHCELPPGMRLIQAVEPGTAFSMRCPLGVDGKGCGLALRLVPEKSQERLVEELRAEVEQQSLAYSMTEHLCPWCPTTCVGDLTWYRHLAKEHRPIWETLKREAEAGSDG